MFISKRENYRDGVNRNWNKTSDELIQHVKKRRKRSMVEKGDKPGKGGTIIGKKKGYERKVKKHGDDIVGQGVI